MDIIKNDIDFIHIKLSECESADEAEQYINQLDELSDYLIQMLNNQYKIIKDVALGDHETFMKEIKTLFEINSLIEEL